jgi:hypothetical protein
MSFLLLINIIFLIMKMDLLEKIKDLIKPVQGYRSRRYRRYRPRMPPIRRPAVDYYSNHWISPYEIPREPYYFPGYNIVEYPVPPVRYYWPAR